MSQIYFSAARRLAAAFSKTVGLRFANPTYGVFICVIISIRIICGSNSKNPGSDDQIPSSEIIADRHKIPEHSECGWFYTA